MPTNPAGCGRKLAPGQHWTFCGESDMGQSALYLCEECEQGGLKLARDPWGLPPPKRTPPMPPVIPPARREFVILPRDPSQKPDVPLKVPTHYCLDCGQTQVSCIDCVSKPDNPLQVTYPMTGTQDGFHLGRCDEHGQIAMVCPRRGLADVTPPPSIAGNSDQAELQQLQDRTGVAVERHRISRADAASIARSVTMPSQDLRTDPRVWKVTTVALLVGVVLGLVLGTMIAAPLIVHFSRQQQAPTLVE
jgi:hypothetical protein